jgi:YesN/AraC family two-component response regulator
MPDPLEARTVRVVLADDHDILRQGLKLLLGLQPDMQVVGEARTGREALDLAVALRPDVVVLDITMPEMDGLAVCQRIRQQVPNCTWPSRQSPKEGLSSTPVWRKH